MRNPTESDALCRTTRLPQGARVATEHMSHVKTVSLGLFIEAGSRHEGPGQEGFAHLCEHMAFKGTATRDCQQINLEAELLGAEVNAHTDKDHTAYHMRGLARDALTFVRMLGDIVRHGSFPEAELERERQVILQEFLEDEDDALSTAFKLFDEASFGRHALAQPVIGRRRNIERFSREELTGYVARQYTGSNLIVAVSGPVELQALAREVEGRWIENVYRLQLINTTEAPMDVVVSASGADLPSLSIEYDHAAGHLPPVSNRLVPVRVRVPLEQAPQGTHRVDITVAASGEGGRRAQVRESTSFIVPANP